MTWIELAAILIFTVIVVALLCLWVIDPEN